MPWESKFCRGRYGPPYFRNAYEANALSGIQNGKYVLKKIKENQIQDIEQLFNSVEDHTRKAVQMNSLARNFAKNLELEKPQEFGDTFSYTKVYFGKLNGECVTVENFLDGTTRFSKYVNNTGDIYHDEVKSLRKRRPLCITPM